jgi:5-methylcytosine-specific restriction endonuclease McrA
MPKFEKGDGGYWKGKSRKGLVTHPAVEFVCKCGNSFKRSHYAYKKGLENPKLMPKYCSRTCQLSANKFRVGKQGNQTAFKKLDPRTTGEANTNWKGGITPVVESIRRLPEYKQWRDSIYARDNFTCVKCEQRGGRLNADHAPVMFHKIIEQHAIKSTEEAVKCALLWDITNGQTLCWSCHKKKTVGEMGHIYKDPNRMRGLNRAGGTPGRKWNREVV